MDQCVHLIGLQFEMDVNCFLIDFEFFISMIFIHTYVVHYVYTCASTEKKKEVLWGHYLISDLDYIWQVKFNLP